MKKHRCRRDTIVSAEVRASISKTWESPHRQMEFIKACQELQWTHDMVTPRRLETIGIAEKVFRRVKERTATAMAQCGLPEEWWHNAAERYRCLRNAYDGIADGKRHHMKNDAV